MGRHGHKTAQWAPQFENVRSSVRLFKASVKIRAFQATFTARESWQSKMQPINYRQSTVSPPGCRLITAVNWLETVYARSRFSAARDAACLFRTSLAWNKLRITK